MRAWAVTEPGPIDTRPLRLVDKPEPRPGAGELLVRVRACGVCRTDLHVAEGDLPVRRADVTPGHEVVGDVVELGPGADGFSLGDRVGVAWLHRTDGTCDRCIRGAENLCAASVYTGWDVDGGYAELVTVPAAFAYPLPPGIDDVSIAPLLCAGIIGYRALRRTGLLDDLGAAADRPKRLGLYGFGGSAHLCAQLAIALGIEVHVLTRGEQSRRLAADLGAASVGDATDAPPVPLDAAITFAPVGELVPVAMRALDRGGVLSIAGIHLTDVPPLNYERELFYEKEIRSVTANTRADGAEFLTLAAQHGVRATTHEYPMSQGDRALADLAAGRFDGAAVLVADL
ncbi:zinc-binding alcohol dehydrogenase family protein [Gordonia rubripertincta]|uniref:alcohol dehydrogenase n=2 Tax=Gordonia rubripertincta TaxID=36822 RepID=A0AAW6RI07_GORRU|nr:zinc-binding alcohol dehydrogenase family protein [Gordonia rubripertincta]MDG6783351.1 zinc-binding alcohol dehydrogenase family protein [Gordonia rubripertincta]NKY65578.1 zinc-binding alcohol dehydrogenase family protein [Gordonia rubripertincta]GAB84153.1 putative alcohol dehydrogenase [Gordonia rubripertincta NBRC 101908]